METPSTTATVLPVDNPIPEPGRGPGRRRRTIVTVTAVAALALVGGLVSRDGGDPARTTTPSAPSTTSPARRSTAPSVTTPITAPATGAALPAAAPASPAVASADPTPPAAPADDPSLFDAWLAGDDQLLRELATGPVADFLTARRPHETGGWTGPVCDGAAGSIYCTWSRPDAQLVVRTSSEALAAGQGHAVFQAYFTLPQDGVAVWPFTTADQAAGTQAAVAAGHQPWLLDPVTVAASYAAAELGWPDATVDERQPGSYLVTDPTSGARASLTLSQPAHQGPEGIWAVVSAGSTF
jgi:hypothetical protein